MTLLEDIKQKLGAFADTDLETASIKLWETLGYRSDKQLDIPTDPDDFWASLPASDTLSRANAQVDQWKSAHFLLQLTNDEIPSLAYGQMSRTAGDTSYQKGMIESFVLLAIKLTDQEWTRTKLLSITRELNRAFPMPAIVVFQYGPLLSIAVIDRRTNKRDASKDVIDRSRIAIIKDITVNAPHRAHLEILSDLALANVGKKHTPSNFRNLYESWLRVLSVKELNQRFYNELFTWYCWALKNTTFPKGQTPDSQGRPSVAVIRLLTRLIFVWFVKEKGVVPDELFRLPVLKDLLKEPPDTHPDSSSFYQAILQNLFFATLNTETSERRWKSDGSGGMTSHYLVHSVYRYRAQFRDADRAFSFFKRVPFLNGGLFECLDREVTARDLERHPDLDKIADKEGKAQILRVDGFSDRPKNPLSVPNKLFFSPGEPLDLNVELHTKGRKPATVRGLIEIFSRYKFTIEENTPVEEEVALDPELLGKVFENLLASYNEESQQTVRKQSGSYYTPREVVDYMVNEALVVYLEPYLSQPKDGDKPVARLRTLLDSGSQTNEFSKPDTLRLVSAIENMRTLDPACGSGAFPMGMLQKLVHILSILDPDNKGWEAQNRGSLEQQLKAAASVPDPNLRETRVEEVLSALDKLKRDFSDKHYRDYSRKLYLIEKCLFGVDKQPIAVQIAKLRFFISLVVSQKADQDAPNDNFNITALPNLETKIVAANSLIPLHLDQGSFVGEDAYPKQEELRLANESYFVARTTKTKRKWRDKITSLRDELGDLLEQNPLFDQASAKRVVEWDPFDQNTSASFFDCGWMFGERSGFDIVIGNPPYIKEYNFRDAFNGVRDSPYYQGKMDLWYLFACQAFDILKKPSGVLAFIATNNWVTNSGASKLRQVVAKRTTILKLVDFMDYKVFGSADIQTMILIAKNEAAGAVYTFDLRRLVDSNAEESEMQLLLSGEHGQGLEYLLPSFDRSKFDSTTFTFSADALEAILKKIEAVPRFYLDERAEVAQGIVAPQDTVNNKTASELGNSVKVGEGIFNLTHQEKIGLNLTKAEQEIVKPFFTTEELRRYSADASNDHWVIYTGSRFKDPSAMASYPNLKQHLDRFQSVITSDNWPYGLHRARAPKFFVGEKIISLRKCSAPVFTFTDSDCYVSQTFNVIKTSRIDQRYLTAILNSSVVRFWLRSRGKMQGKLFQVDKEPLLRIPILKPQNEQEQLVSRIVRALIGASGAHGRATSEVLELDYLLNGLVYELYFPDQLHAANIFLFRQLAEFDLKQFEVLSNINLEDAAKQFVSVFYKNDHPIYRMLFDLQALPTVRIIEGKE